MALHFTPHARHGTPSTSSCKARFVALHWRQWLLCLLLLPAGTKTNAGDNSGNTHRNAADGAFAPVWGLLGSAVLLLFTLF